MSLPNRQNMATPPWSGSPGVRRPFLLCSRVLIAACTTTAILGCQVSPPAEPILQSTQPIVGGTEATTCAWPTAVMMLGSLVCSGTLVHPRAVVTARHCVMNEIRNQMRIPSMVGFGESRNNWAKTVNVQRCHVHPKNDIALCILDEAVTEIPIIPVMAPCETDELLPGKPIVEVGFGVTGTRNPTYGTKKWINGVIEGRSADLVDILVTTGTQDGEYFGDSGGPLFFRMPDQSWRLIGEDCCSDEIADAGPRVSTYTSVPYHVVWMEEQSGLDLTPCHDEYGWSPDVSCTGVTTEPLGGVGSWANMCQGGTRIDARTCAVSPDDAGARRDTREASAGTGGRDVPDDLTRDTHIPDLAVSDGPTDAPDRDAPDSRPDTDHPDEPGPSQDSLVPLPDGFGIDGSLANLDAARAAAEVSANKNEATDSSATPLSVDTAQMLRDGGRQDRGTSVPEVDPDLADALAATDGHKLRDTLGPDGDTQQNKSPTITGGLTIRRVGCACRSGGTGQNDAWPTLCSLSIVLLAGRLLARRRSPRRTLCRSNLTR